MTTMTTPSSLDWLWQRTLNERALKSMQRRQDWMMQMLRLNLSWYAYWALSLSYGVSKHRKNLDLPLPPSLEPPPTPSLDPDVQGIIARVQGDGGMITDEAFLDALIVDLKAAGVYTLFDALYVPIAIKKDGSNLVSKIYDLSLIKAGIYYDLDQSNPVKQQLWENSKIDGKPCISFDPAKGGGYNSAAIVVYADYPVTYFLISQYITAPDNYRTIFRVISGTTDLYNASYYNASIMLLLAKGQTNVNTNCLDMGQFTFLFDSSATVRRKGMQIASGTCGSQTPMANCNYDLGGSACSASIAFAASIRQAITDQQRDVIENLLNTKHYSSTVA